MIMVSGGIFKFGGEKYFLLSSKKVQRNGNRQAFD